MDEKTEELRDIFLDVAEEATVTESQSEQRGSLQDRGDVDERLRELVDEMCDRYDIDTSLSRDQLVTLVSAFYDGDSDGDIANQLDVSRRTVIRARLQLHLVREGDREAPFDGREGLRLRDEGATMADLTDRYGVSESTVRRYLRVFEMERRSRQVNQRYRDEFDSLLADSELSMRMVQEVHEDGLEEATEGMETNVSF